MIYRVKSNVTVDRNGLYSSARNSYNVPLIDLATSKCSELIKKNNLCISFKQTEFMSETAARPLYDINNSLAYCCQKKTYSKYELFVGKLCLFIVV